MSKLETNTIDTVSGTSTLQVGSTNTTTITLGASGDTINIPSGATIANSGTATGFGGANTPAFKVKNASDQSLSNATAAKLTLDSEIFDTDSAFASNKFTVPSGKAGKYFISLQISLEGQNDIQEMKGMIYKNGSFINDIQFKQKFNSDLIDGGTHMFLNANGILDLSVSDYLEVYVYISNSGGGVYVAKGGCNFFQGYRLVE